MCMGRAHKHSSLLHKRVHAYQACHVLNLRPPCQNSLGCGLPCNVQCGLTVNAPLPELSCRLVHTLQELGPDQHWVSETLFGIMFALFVLWTFSPFVMQHKRFYTVVMWSRLLMVLVGKQAPMA